MNKYDLYYQIAKSALDDQDQRNRELQGKATHLASLSILLLSLGVIVLKDFSGTGMVALSAISWVFLAKALGLFICTVVSAIQVLKPDDWVRNPAVKDFAPYIDDTAYADSRMLKWAADETDKSVQKNERLINRKAAWLRVGFVSASLLVVMIGVLAVLVRV